MCAGARLKKALQGTLADRLNVQQISHSGLNALTDEDLARARLFAGHEASFVTVVMAA